MARRRTRARPGLDTPASAAVFVVLMVALVVAIAALFNELLGYVLMGLTLLFGLVGWHEQSKDDGPKAGGSALVLALGTILGAGTCGVMWNRSVAENISRGKQEAAAENQRVRAEQESRNQAIRASEQERTRLIQAELSRPLDERAAEAENRIIAVTDRTGKAQAICYADVLLDGAQDTPAVKSLRKTRNKVAKEILAEYKADMTSRRVLVCRDGDFSGCRCSGSHRGCCSSHGGVARCEPVPKVEIVCEPQGIADLLDTHLAAIGRPLPGETTRKRGQTSPLRMVN